MMNQHQLEPIRLAANQPEDRFYRGGAQIANFRRGVNASDRIPEDWIASTTSVRGEDPAGQTVLPDGRRLSEAVSSDPAWWLGAEHVEAFGADTKLLVKLLDAGQRLPVHAHPSDLFAETHLGLQHGKAEAWYILTPGVVHLGLTKDFSHTELQELVDSQRVSELLSAMHRVNVNAGDRVYVPPGVLHAIGAGVFLAEVQEPADLSILLEWEGFAVDGPGTGHLGLGFPLALAAVETRGRTADQVEDLIVRTSSAETGLPKAADEYFRLARIDVSGDGRLEEGFAVVIALSGVVEIHGDWGSTLLDGGSTWVLPAAVAGRELSGDGSLLVVYPPRHG
jgi:mannose-6-phosphate isomerase